jgi:hypothetical protein
MAGEELFSRKTSSAVLFIVYFFVERFCKPFIFTSTLSKSVLPR